MPAVTPTTTLDLPIVRVTDEQATRSRPVLNVVTAIATFEGEGFPVRRPSAASGIAPSVTNDVPGPPKEPGTSQGSGSG